MNTWVAEYICYVKIYLNEKSDLIRVANWSLAKWERNYSLQIMHYMNGRTVSIYL